MKIKIGITTGLDSNSCKDYGSAIENLGAIPVFLNPGNYTPQTIKGLSGLLLAGGRDIDPHNYISRLGRRYDQSLLKEYHINPDPARDEMETALIKSAINSNIPIFGICRGLQMLNIALGGRIIMDIQTEVRHTRYTLEKSAMHSIRMVQKSRLAEILHMDEMQVNSRHHQGITDAELAPGLRASAYAADGIIEAVEGIEKTWITAVQWHPEREVDADVHRPCKKLFAAFADVCAAKTTLF